MSLTLAVRLPLAWRINIFLFVPGSDALFLLALINVIFTENLVDYGHLAPYLTGAEQLQALVIPYTPENVAPVTGIPATTIRQVGLDFAQAPTAVCYGRIGLSIQPFGGVCQWLTQLLNLLTGNLDQVGGAMFTTPAVDVRQSRSRGSHGRWHSRLRGIPEFGGELPVATLAEEILTPGEGQIQAMVTVAGNPVLSTPNGRQLDKALAGLQFMVAIDIYINETTRHAHIILPPTTGLETAHYDLLSSFVSSNVTVLNIHPLFSHLQLNSDMIGRFTENWQNVWLLKNGRLILITH